MLDRIIYSRPCCNLQVMPSTAIYGVTLTSFCIQ